MSALIYRSLNATQQKIKHHEDKTDSLRSLLFSKQDRQVYGFKAALYGRLVQLVYQSPIHNGEQPTVCVVYGLSYCGNRG